MINECSIVRDILPLYVEGMVSEDTADFVKEHLESCAECRSVHERLKEPEAIQNDIQAYNDVAPLINLRRKLTAKKIQTVLMTAFFVAAVIISVFAILSSPEYFPYTDGLINVTENSDGSITVTFDEKVTNYDCYRYSAVHDSLDCWHIEAWTCPWERFFTDHGTQSLTIQPKDGAMTMVYYTQNNGMDDVLVYGQSPEDSGVRTLPRSVLGFYLVVMAVAFCILAAVWFIVKKNSRIRVWVERAILFPVSYAVGHFIVLGFSTDSYSSTRDFILILAVSVLIYCGLLLAHSIYRLRKEIKDIE